MSNNQRFVQSSEIFLWLKKSVEVHCDEFVVRPFLTQEEWKSSGEFEAIINDASKMTKICQNEEKLNVACGPVIRKVLYYGFYCGNMKVLKTED